MGVIAESKWRGGEQKKLEFCKVDMPTKYKIDDGSYVLKIEAN